MLIFCVCMIPCIYFTISFLPSNYITQLDAVHTSFARRNQPSNKNLSFVVCQPINYLNADHAVSGACLLFHFAHVCIDHSVRSANGFVRSADRWTRARTISRDRFVLSTGCRLWSDSWDCILIEGGGDFGSRWGSSFLVVYRWLSDVIRKFDYADR